MTDNSQKFIARNRAPRVQIEYDVELYGSQKSVQLPFVMGVMSDLAGKSRAEPPALEDRKFLEIDVDNFDDRMKAMQPRAVFSVPNTLTGDGNLEVDLTFESMRDFTPAAIAGKIEPLRALLEARTQLANLTAYMDGKAGAEALIERILQDPSLLSALSDAAPTGAEAEAALASLRDVAVDAEPEADGSGDVLDALRARAPAGTEPDGDSADAVLDGLARVEPAPQEAQDDSARVLDGLRRAEPDEEEAPDRSADVLADLAAAAPETEAAADTATDALASLKRAEVATEDDTDRSEDVLSTLAANAPEQVDVPDDAGAALDSLAAVEVAEEEPGEDVDALLGDLASEAPEEVEAEDDAGAALDSLAAVEVAEEALADDIDGLLGDLTDGAPDTDADVADTDLDDILGDLTAAASEDMAEVDQTGDILDGLASAEGAAPEDDDLDALLGDLATDADTGPEQDDLDALLGDLGRDTPDPAAEPDAADDAGGLDDLDDLLGDLAEDASDPPEAKAENAAEDDLDDLLAGLNDPADTDAGDDLDALPGDLEAGAEAGADQAGAGADLSGEPEFAYGVMSADRPDPQRLNRRRFRIAIMGDFSGRAARGMLETGDALAARRAILLDPDTAEEVIEGFAADLVLPIGKDGAGVAVRLNGLDDLHPDELYEKVELFAELNGLRGQLSAGTTAANAAQRLREWGEKHGRPVSPPKSRSAGNAVPADLKLSDFQKLIGDTKAELAQPSPVEDLIARVVGPHVRDLPDTDMVKAVDAAISSAMRMILHHPEFQSVEAQWRAIDLIARSIETDDTLDVMLYDISAEEIAADLSAADDLSQSGLVRLLTEEPLDEENGRGGYSALIGLYTFEETPPHAELLGRIARVAAHVDAPFLSAISPAFLEVAKEDRHPIVAQAWDTLRAMPEAGYLGLVSPRFLLRRPYGAKTEPIYEFEFEEFTMAEGMKGMLWANPAVLVAILLARSFRENGASMGLGSVMSLGDMPYHYVTDRYGDQVALPCTERNLTLDKIEIAVQRGYMPVSSVKGRDEVRLTSFQSLAGKEISGPWSGETPPPASPPTPEPVAAPDGTIEQGGDAAAELDDLLADFSDDLDIGDDPDSDGGDSGDIDADLAALLEDL